MIKWLKNLFKRQPTIAFKNMTDNISISISMSGNGGWGGSGGSGGKYLKGGSYEVLPQKMIITEVKEESRMKV